MFSGKKLKVRNEGGGDRAELIIGGTRQDQLHRLHDLGFITSQENNFILLSLAKDGVQLGAVYFTRDFLTLIFKFEVCCILRRLVMEARAGSQTGSPGRQSPTTGEQRTSSKDISS